MRLAGNFSPEWGYLSPVPSFIRTARIVVVATAIGATAGAAVVLALVDRPAADSNQAAVAAHAIVSSVEAAPATGAPSNDAAAASTTAPINVTTVTPPVSPSAAGSAPGAKQSAAIAVPPPSHVPAETPDMGKTNSYPTPAPKPAAGMASLSDGPPPGNDTVPADGAYGATGATPTAAQPNTAPKTGHTGVTYYSSKPPALGAMLRRLFSAHNGVSYFPNN
jgi:hypothetical protein